MDTTEFKDSWNVFAPIQIQFEFSCYLCGEIKEDLKLVCIYGIYPTHCEGFPSNVVGYWQRSDKDDQICPTYLEKFSLNIWITLSSKGTDIMLCTLKQRTGLNIMREEPVVCVLFSPQDIVTSFLLSEAPGTKEKEAAAVVTKCLYLNSNSKEKKVKIYHNDSGPTLFTKLLCSLPRMFISLLCWICLCFKKLFLCFHPAVLKQLSKPSICQHFIERYHNCWTVGTHKPNSKYQQFVTYNSLFQQLLDSAIGISLCLFIVFFSYHDYLSSLVLGWADDVALELGQLVKALMGAPAGLKLNARLTETMGLFFQYHIYLWTGYLGILKSVMPSIIWYTSWIGVLGVSCQLCLISDLLSALTLHIYCFYVYAARMFHLQVYAIRSLWRLFRGKKWNVLRSRVDSAMYNTDQLFVGTLLFTVLLFLLPTTALYYTVFTVLRILVLTVQGLLLRLVSVALSIPVFTILVRVIAPKLVSGSVMFRVYHVPECENCLVLTMQTSQLPAKDLLSLSFPKVEKDQTPRHTWIEFLSNLATGRLVYPWVERVSNH